MGSPQVGKLNGESSRYGRRMEWVDETVYDGRAFGCEYVTYQVMKGYLFASGHK